jgi:hypothetical protein
MGLGIPAAGGSDWLVREVQRLGRELDQVRAANLFAPVGMTVGAGSVTFTGKVSLGPFVDLTRGSAQTIAPTTVTDVAWDSETEDAGDYHTAGSARVTIPKGAAGLYMWSAQASFFGNATGTWRGLIVNKTTTYNITTALYDGGAGVRSGENTTDTPTIASRSDLVRLGENDYLTVSVWHNATVSCNIRPGSQWSSLRLVRVGA